MWSGEAVFDEAPDHRYRAVRTDGTVQGHALALITPAVLGTDLLASQRFRAPHRKKTESENDINSSFFSGTLETSGRLDRVGRFRLFTSTRPVSLQTGQ